MPIDGFLNGHWEYRFSLRNSLEILSENPSEEIVVIRVGLLLLDILYSVQKGLKMTVFSYEVFKISI